MKSSSDVLGVQILEALGIPHEKVSYVNIVLESGEPIRVGVKMVIVDDCNLVVGEEWERYKVVEG
jgi:hypothetical protein